jgi:PAS domain-containing protein
LVRTKAQPILDDSGNVEQYFAMIDATEKKLHEEILRNEREKYSNIIAKYEFGLIEADQEEKIILANNSFCQMSGYDLKI